MVAVFTLVMFMLDRVRTVLVALSLIILMKAAWICIALTAG